MEGETENVSSPSRASMLVTTHGDVLFAPPDGTSDWQEEFEWVELVIFPDMKVALRSYHGRFLSDQLDGSLVWNKENIGSQELWGLQLLRFVARAKMKEAAATNQH